MRRVGIIAVLSLALLAIAAPVAQAAPWRWPSPTYVARAGQAEPTETLRVGARALWLSPFARVTASAVVHFASGTSPSSSSRAAGAGCTSSAAARPSLRARPLAPCWWTSPSWSGAWPIRPQRRAWCWRRPSRPTARRIPSKARLGSGGRPTPELVTHETGPSRGPVSSCPRPRGGNAGSESAAGSERARSCRSSTPRALRASPGRRSVAVRSIAPRQSREVADRAGTHGALMWHGCPWWDLRHSGRWSATTSTCSSG